MGKNKLKIIHISGIILILLSVIYLILLQLYISNDANKELEKYNCIKPDSIKNTRIVLVETGRLDEEYQIIDMHSGKVLDYCVFKFDSKDIWKSEKGIARKIDGGFFSNIFPYPLSISVFVIILGILLLNIKSKDTDDIVRNEENKISPIS
jgi:hypothetical protein